MNCQGIKICYKQDTYRWYIFQNLGGSFPYIIPYSFYINIRTRNWNVIRGSTRMYVCSILLHSHSLLRFIWWSLYLYIVFICISWKAIMDITTSVVSRDCSFLLINWLLIWIKITYTYWGQSLFELVFC